MISLFEELGHGFLFFNQVLKTCRRTLGARSSFHGTFQAILQQTASISYRSLSTVIFSGMFVGAILVLQFQAMLARFDANIFLGGLNTSAVIREVGPLIISFLLAGKVGAYIAAELATMRVTEQIDAIECLGTDPVHYLIVPRFVGIVVSSMLLLSIGLAVSVVGSILVAQIVYGINPLQYLNSLPRFVGMSTLAGGMFRSLVYGTIVATVSCYQGFHASGGAAGVGKAVTRAAIYTNVSIVVANFVTAQLLDWVFK